MNLQLELERRKFLAEKGDEFALEDPSKSGSGLAHRFARELAGEDSTVEKASVRGLETLAWSTESVADILDYIRVRVGRDTSYNKWARKNVGGRLAEALEKLRPLADDFMQQHHVPDKEEARRLHLELCREFIKHLAALFEFYKSGAISRGSSRRRKKSAPANRKLER